MGTFVIAEAACGWNGDLKQAEHSIRMAKAHGADAWKTQWTSDPVAMAARRGMPDAAEKLKRLAWPAEYHKELAGMCAEHGIEYMCTTFLVKDIAVINPHVNRFKVSAFERGWYQFVASHLDHDKETIVSVNNRNVGQFTHPKLKHLWCVSKYPTPIDEIGLRNVRHHVFTTTFDPIEYIDGLSDHTTSKLTGALAVAAGATIIEKHVKTIDMLPSDPDQPHSLSMNGTDSAFGEYVRNIREAEKAL